MGNFSPKPKDTQKNPSASTYPIHSYDRFYE